MPITKENVENKALDTPPFMETNESPEYISYSTEEVAYLDFLKKRLRGARDMREKNYDEFNRRSYTARYKDNMQKAYTFIAPLENPEDTSVDTGTIRFKGESIVSAVMNLNFKGDVRAFNKEDKEDEIIGSAMTDMIFKSEIIENWDEKKILAYWEQVFQGNVFIEETWVDETRINKKKVKFDSVTSSDFKKFDPQKGIKTVFSGCRRNLLAGTQVYFGNIFEPTVENQPFLFTRDLISWAEAKALYGNWVRFKYVPKKPTQVNENDDFWCLENDFDSDKVEVIKYQDKWNDEYQITLNGIMMLPVGFPMPWEYGEYNIAMGRLEPLSPFMIYGKSLAEKTKFEQEVLNEMFRLMILSTQKKFMPPMANMTGQNLTKIDLLPGNIINDADPNKLAILGGPYGVTQDEMSVISYIKGIMDDKTVASIVQGASPEGRQTATEIQSIMAQAKQQLGLIIAGFINLERSLDMLRLYNIVENWTKPIGKEIDDIKKGIFDKYRTISIDMDLPGKGRGKKIVNLTESVRTPAELMASQEGLEYPPQEGRPNSIFDFERKPKKTPQAYPKKIIDLNPKELRSIDYNWYVSITPSEKDTSLLAKTEFEQSLMNALNIWGPTIAQNPEIQERWARYNKFSPDVFKQAPPPNMGTPGTPPPPVTQVPGARSSAGAQMSNISEMMGANQQAAGMK